VCVVISEESTNSVIFQELFLYLMLQDVFSAQVGNINSSNLKTTLKGASNADYCFTSNHQNLMVTLSFKSSNPEIRDLDTGKIVHTLGMSGLKTSRVACHQKLPILATTLDDGTICLWDASTYK
jgi:coatomer subunit beta'